LEENYDFCSSCDKDIGEGTKFCSGCGTEIQEETQPQNSNSEQDAFQNKDTANEQGFVYIMDKNHRATLENEEVLMKKKNCGAKWDGLEASTIDNSTSGKVSVTSKK